MKARVLKNLMLRNKYGGVLCTIPHFDYAGKVLQLEEIGNNKYKHVESKLVFSDKMLDFNVDDTDFNIDDVAIKEDVAMYLGKKDIDEDTYTNINKDEIKKRIVDIKASPIKTYVDEDVKEIEKTYDDLKKEIKDEDVFRNIFFKFVKLLLTKK